MKNDNKNSQLKTNLLAFLEANSQQIPDNIAYRFLFDDKSEPQTLTFRELHHVSQKLGLHLISKVAPGDRVMIMMENSLEYVAAFFACHYAGAVAVTAFPYHTDDPRSGKLLAFAKDCQPKALLTTADCESETEKFIDLLGVDKHGCSIEVVSAEDRSAPAETIDIAFIKADSLAMLQYTSGSTGAPKGVMLTQKNLLANARGACEVTNLEKDKELVSWLPIFHDLGLVGAVLTGVYRGGAVTLLRPVYAIRNPLFWLEVMSRYRAHMTFSPNFGLDILARAVQKFKQNIKHLDLSALQVALCGGEPIRLLTVELFNSELSVLGVKNTTFTAGYGLAEATNYMTATPYEKVIRHLLLDKSALKQNQVVILPDESNSQDKSAIAVMSVGAFNHCSVIIVDPQSHHLLGENEIGVIWSRGDSVGLGYWNKPEQTEKAFRNRITGAAADGLDYVSTGDMGFINDGEVFVTGRIKDMISIRGENYYPQDIETLASEVHEVLNINNAVAFGIEVNDEEKACLVIEPYHAALKKINEQDIDLISFFKEIINQIQQRIFEFIGISLYDIVIVKPRAIPKTTSGKLERSKTKTMYESEMLSVLACLRQSNKQKQADFNHTVVVSDEAKTQAVTLLLDCVANVLECPAEQIDIFEPVASYGLDSIKVVQFFDELSQRLAQELPPTLLYRHPSIDALAQVVAQSLMKPHTNADIQTNPINTRKASESIESSATLGQQTIAGSNDNNQSAIAIVGMAARMPDADNIDEFWQNLAQAKDSVVEQPSDRGEWRNQMGQQPLSWGAYLTDFDKFDSDFFKISPHEAMQMDPQQRLLLQSTWHAIEDAGLTPASLSGSNTAVFFGVSNWDYSEHLRKLGEPVYGHTSIGQAHTMLANRVSYLFNLRGPSEPVDTACSSSLVAVDKAVQAILSGRCDLAIVGAVNLMTSPTLHEAFEKAGMLSPDGRCKTFGEGANGYVRGEGVGVFILKPLQQAEQDGDNIHAVILGSAVNHGGKASTLTSPNVLAQQQVITSAHQAANIDPATISYVEAHGTGTALGDPVEIDGLKLAFAKAKNTSSGFTLGLGSVKSNIGHLEPAAGMAGMIKVIKSMQHKTLVPSLHSACLNPLIDLDDSGFYVVQQRQDWPQQKSHDDKTQSDVIMPLRAGVSSFGFGGVNAHVVLQEYQPSAKQQQRLKTAINAPRGPYAIVLSAKTDTQLTEQIQQFADYVTQHDELLDETQLLRLAYTLQFGREAMHARIALVVATGQELREKLTLLAQGDTSVSSVYRGHCKRGETSLMNDDFMKQGVKQWLLARQFQNLLNMWVEGLDVDWSSLYDDQRPQKMSLPTYPFEKKSYWINGSSNHSASSATQAILHPLLHQNTSTFEEQRFSSTLTGTEDFLKDHQVDGKSVLPGVAYVEMALTAALKACDIEFAQQQFQLSNIVWLQPIVVDSKTPQTVHIALTPESDKHFSFDVYSDDEHEAQIYSQGEIALLPPAEQPQLDLSVLQAQVSDEMDVSDIYQTFTEKALVYGPSHKGLKQVFRQIENGVVTQVLAQITLADCHADQRYLLPPGMLDSALQASLCFTPDIHQAPKALPFALEQVRVLTACPKQVYVSLRQASNPSDPVQKIDLDFYDTNGQLCLQLLGFSTRTLSSHSGGTELVPEPLTSAPQLASESILAPEPIPAPEPGPGPELTNNELPHTNADWREQVTQYLLEHVAKVLSLPSSEIETDEPFEQYGIDSVLVLEIIQTLETEFGALPKTLFFEYPTMLALTDYFIEHHSDTLSTLVEAPAPSVVNQTPKASVSTQTASAKASAAASSPIKRLLRRSRQPQQPSRASPLDIAVVGLSGRYPQADNLDQFWQKLTAGEDLITEVPASRWDWRQYYSGDRSKAGKHFSKWGGFLNRVDDFDPRFFNIAPRDAELMDPQERLFLQEAWKALEDAGYTKAGLDKLTGPNDLALARQVGVYVGVLYGEYQLFASDSQAVNNSFAGIANRISFLLDLHGPSLAVDTMCSSSLTALHLAVEDLRNYRTNMAIAGGVNVTIHPNKYLMLSQGQFISTEGHCRAFGEGGEGYIPGEGVGVVILKRLEDAERDHDHIYGVIKGSALNHGGKASGYTVPNPAAQSNVIAQAINQADIDIRQVNYVEAHGTGTSLGDPIEITALNTAFGQDVARQSCAIGSVKSNMGHGESAAGISGLSKVLLQLKHKQLVPSLHSQTLNPYIDFANSPFKVNQTLREWEAPTINGTAMPRVASISSFGAGGSNAHMLIQEYQPSAQQQQRLSQALTSAQGPYAIVLSAKTDAQLTEQIQQLADYVADRLPVLDDAQLLRLAYTLQMGREAMHSRLALVVDSAQQLSDKLTALVRDERSVNGVYRGHCRRGEHSLKNDDLLKQSVKQWLVARQFQNLLNLWVEGLDVDWSSLYDGQYPQKMSLPTYPFEKKRYWVNTNQALSSEPTATVMHPLLHHNTSTLDEQRFSSTFTGAEAFLTDHQIDGKSVLPGVAYVEMVHTAALKAFDIELGQQLIELSNIVWLQPIVLDGSQSETVHIGLIPQTETQLSFEVYTEHEQDILLHSQGDIALLPPEPQSRVDWPSLQAQTPDHIDVNDIYRVFSEGGLNYGPSHQGLKQISRRVEGGEVTQVLAQIELPSSHDEAQYILPPGVLDSALQASLCFATDIMQAPKALPFALEAIRVLSACPQQVYVSLRKVTSAHDSVQKVDLDIYDKTGQLCLQLRGFSTRLLSAAPTPERQTSTAAIDQTLLFEPVWKTETVGTGNDSADSQVWFVGEDADYTRLQQHMTQAGASSLQWRHFQSPSDHHDKGYSAVCLQLLDALQTTLSSTPKTPLRLTIVVPDHSSTWLGLNGLIKSVSQEQPKLLGQVIALNTATMTQAVSNQLAKQLTAGKIGDCLRYQGEQMQRLSWQAIATEMTPTSSMWREQGVYLITGGAGGLGLLSAQEIAANTSQATVVLCGRRPVSALEPSAAAALETLTQQGLDVDYRALDISDAQAVSDLVDDVVNHYGALNGVIHSAGVIQDAYLKDKTAESFTYIISPKITGLLNLDRATAALALDVFITYSSVSAVNGNAGQMDYACANSFMDHWITTRHKQVQQGQRSGLSLSVNWPLWLEGGMRVDPGVEKYLYANYGIRPLTTQQGFSALSDCLRLGKNRAVVLHGDVSKLPQLLGLSQTATVDVKQTGKPAVTVSATAQAQTNSDHANHAQIHEASQNELDAGQLQSNLLQLLLEGVADHLKIDIEELDADVELSEFGFDSISLTSFTNELNQQFDLKLKPTVFFETPTLDSFSAYLCEHHAEQLAIQLMPTAPVTEPVATAAQTSAITAHTAEADTNKAQIASPVSRKPRRRFSHQSANPSQANNQDIAIIGISGAFPDSPTLSAFWDNLINGVDCISEVPSKRWDWQALYGDPLKETNKTNIKWGGFMPGMDEFDHTFFNISPKEAQLMDPQQRLLIQHTWQVIEDAGYDPKALSGSHTALFIGTGNTGYQDVIAQSGLPIEGYSATGSIPSVGPNRISFMLNLHGASEPIETACSSALVAVHRGVQAIRAGQCEQAIVGGVNTLSSPSAFISFNKAGMLCEDGRCKTFSEDANGYVRGEGVGLFLLKTLAKAEADGDHIYGLIKGSAENHGGRANSLTAPNVNAQAMVIQQAYEDAKLDPSTVNYIEAHGTGTPLGDPVEINGLKKAFGQMFDKQGIEPSKQYCALGAVKTNIGHLELAAGAAGLMKVLLQLKHQTLAKNLNLNKVNPYIELADSPFYLLNQSQPWQALTDAQGNPLPRRASISSFGFGGVNAHVVVEEYQPSRQQHQPQSQTQLQQQSSGPYAILLSAKTDGQLITLAKQLAQHAQRTHDHEADYLARLAYTLQTGREQMQSRLALVVDSVQELTQKLEAVVQGQTVAGVYLGHSQANHLQDEQHAMRQARVQQCLNEQCVNEQGINRQDFDELLPWWVEGMAIDWLSLYRHHTPQKISLPGYPFEPISHWPAAVMQEPRLNSNLGSQGQSVQEHPLIGHQLNLPFSKDTRFVANLHANKPRYMADHKLFGTVVSPGASHVCSILLSSPEVLHSKAIAVEAVNFEQAMILHKDNSLEVQIIYEASEHSDNYFWQLVSTSEQQHHPVVHASGDVSAIDQHQILPSWMPLTAEGLVDFDLSRFTESSKAEEFYGLMRDNGYELGDSFKWLSEIYKGDKEAYSILQFPPLPDSLDDYPVYPGLLDSVFQMLTPCCESFIDLENGKYLYVPTMLQRLCLYRPIVPNEPLRCYSQQIEALCSKTELAANICLLDETGSPVLIIEQFQGRRVRRELLLSGVESDDPMAQMFYHVNWQQSQDQRYWAPPEFLPTADALAGLVNPEWLAAVQDESLKDYPQMLQQLETRSLEYILAALKQLGWAYAKGTVISPEQVVTDLGIKPNYARLVYRMLTAMAETSYLSIDQDDFVVQQALPKKVLNISSMTHLDATMPEVILLTRCGEQLAKVLTDQQDPLALLFPEGDATTAAAIYTDSYSATKLNQCMTNLVSACAEQLPEHRQLRILEIGAGTGGTTAHLLPALADANVEYVFTDISSLFLSQAKTKFAAYPFVRYDTLNIEQSPLEQGFKTQQFDLVIASNVVHATANLDQTLGHIRQLLAPNGMLMLMEITQKLYWLDLTFGLTDGWWGFEDIELRRHHPLIAPDEWHRLLPSCGFAAVATATDNGDLQDVMDAQSVIIAQNNQTKIAKHWLLVDDGQNACADVIKQITAAGDLCSVVMLPDSPSIPDIKPAHDYRLASLTMDAFSTLLSHLEAERGTVVEEVLLPCVTTANLEQTDADALMNAMQPLVETCLSVMQTLVSDTNRHHCSFRLLTTRSAVVEGDKIDIDDEHIVGLTSSFLWGMGKALRLEQPDLSCQIIDVDDFEDKVAVEQLMQVLYRDIDEPEVAIRGSHCYYSRLTHMQGYDTLKQSVHIEADASYLITGGLNGLGLMTAEYLIEQGATALILVGRSAPKLGVQQQLEQWQADGIKIMVHLGDVGDFATMERLFIEGLPTLAPLKGIFHSAGTLDDGGLITQNWQKFTQVMRAKVQGSWNLHRLSKPMQLDYFVMYSSAAALIGSPGQSNHSAANSFMDALAAYRKAQGLSALSINWGPWQEIGAAAEQKSEEYLSAQGIGSILPQEGLLLLDKLVANTNRFHQAGAMKVDWQKFSKQLERLQFSSYFEIMKSMVASASSEQASQASLLQSLNEVNETERLNLLVSLIVEQVANTLGMDDEAKQYISTEVSLKELGLDSLAGIGLVSDLNNLIGVKLPSKSLMEDPSAMRLADICHRKLVEEGLIEPCSQPQSVDSSKQKKKANWIVRQTNAGKSDTELRVFCLHYLGGGASVFANWSKDLPDNVEVCAIQLPGRENRSDETPFDSMTSVVEQLLVEIEPLMDKPFVVYGHSMGSLIGFELIRAIRRRFNLTPEHFWAAAYFAPDAISPFQKTQDWNKDNILAILPRLINAPKSLIESEDFISSMLPIIEGDLAIVSRYQYQQEQPLTCPITVLGGKKDREVLSRDLEKWRHHTSKEFDKQILPGGHIFVTENRDKVLGKIREVLQTIINT